VVLKDTPVKEFNNITEQDQQAIKRGIRPLLRFKLFQAAQRAVAGIKVMAMIKKGAADGR
jgi:transposase-like protein